MNLFANSVIALNAQTGKRIWHCQLVHHDLWDMDLPAPPTLLTVTHNGRRIDALAQGTKMGPDDAVAPAAGRRSSTQLSARAGSAA